MDYFDIGLESILVDEGTFTDFCMESYLDELNSALESDAFFAEAMESVGKDSIGVFSTYNKQLSGVRKEMNAAAKAGDYKTAAKKARECAGIGKKMAAACDKIPADANAGSVMRIALTIVAILAAIAIGAKAGSKTGLGDKVANSAPGQKAIKAYGELKHGQAVKSADNAFAKAKAGIGKAEGFKAKAQATGKAIKAAGGMLEARTTNTADAVGRRQATQALQKSGAAVGAGIAGGMAAGGSALAKFVANRKGKASEMNPNEKSMLFKLVKQDAKLIEKGYLKKAEKYDAMAKSKPAKESFLDALESFTGMSFTEEPEVAMESDYAGFLDGLWED